MENNLRKLILQASYKAGACHIGSALSCIDILEVLFSLMKKEDRFIFSKASGVAALYAVLAKKGIIPKNKVAHYLKNYPLSNKKVPGVLWSGGSLGHGLPVACGMAYADRDRKLYCLMSDGEMEEGTTWESALFAAHHKLGNLVVIIDKNSYQACGSTKEILGIEPLLDKWKAFGWQAVEIIDGHNHSNLKNVLDNTPRKENKPTCIIVNTVKGKGVSFMEDRCEWMYWNLTPKLLKQALKELK